MLTPQNFGESHRNRQICSDASSAFGYSSRTAGALSSDDLLPSTVPTTPEQLVNRDTCGTVKPKMHHQDYLGDEGEKEKELTEDPLEDFKKNREERRRKQIKLVCNVQLSNSDSQQFTAIERSADIPIVPDDKIQSFGHRPRKYCTVKLDGKNSILKRMKAIGILIPNSQLNPPEAADREVRNAMRNAGKICQENAVELSTGNAKADAVVPSGSIPPEKGKGINSFGSSIDNREQNGSSKILGCYAYESAENHSLMSQDMESHPVADSSESRDHCICHQTEGGTSVEENQGCPKATEEATAKQGNVGGVNAAFKARQFIVNGEVCYLVPAKLILNKMQKTMKFEVSSRPGLGPSSASDQLNQNNSKNRRSSLQGEPRLRVKSLGHVRSQLHIQRGCNWFLDDCTLNNFHSFQSFSVLETALEQADKALNRKKNVLKPLSPHYPSVKRVKRPCCGGPFLRISRLLKSHRSSEFESQHPNKVQNSSEHNRVIYRSSPKGDSVDKLPFRKGQMFQFVIKSSKAGTFILATGNRCQDIDEPPLWIGARHDAKQKMTDQIVPDLSCNRTYYTNAVTPEMRRSNYVRRGGKDEMNIVLQKIKSVIGASNDLDKYNVAAYACDVITDLRMRIKAILKTLGCSDSAAHVILEWTYTNDLSLDQETPLFSTPNYTPEFRVPQTKETPTTSRLKPAQLCRLTSPPLKVDGSNWSNTEEQSYASSQCQSSLPLSSQLSISESLTDDSENVNEFDLLFENSPSGNDKRPRQNGSSTSRSNGSTFHAYVNEVLDEILEDDFDACGKTTPKKQQDPACLAELPTPIGQTLSPPWSQLGLSPSEMSSHCGDTPQSFSVNNLDCDLQEGALSSPKWYQTVEQGVFCHATGVGDIHEGFSMKVVKEDSCRHREQKIRSRERRTRVEDCGTKKKKFRDESNHREEKNADQREFYGFVKGQDCVDSHQNPDEDVIALKNLESIAKEKSEDDLQPPLIKKTVFAKDLLNSNLLASFLFPCPRLIPEDPFGIGAETVIEEVTEVASKKDDGHDEGDGGHDNESTAWRRDIDVTPPLPKRGFFESPPKIVKSKATDARKEGKIEYRIATRKRPRPRKDLIDLQKTPERVDSDECDSEKDFVFIPTIHKDRNQENSQFQKLKSLKQKRKRRCSADVTCFTTTKSNDVIQSCTKAKRRKTNATSRKRKALNSIN